MLELLIGKCVASEKIKKFTLTIDTVNSIIVECPDFYPAMEMKARVSSLFLKYFFKNFFYLLFLDPYDD